jgi:hypothetical protein
MLGIGEGNRSSDVRLARWSCPNCLRALSPPVRCPLGGGCSISPWDGVHFHAACVCGVTILYSTNGEVFLASYSRMAVKHRRRKRSN